MNETQSWISRRLCIGVWPTLFSINRLGQLSSGCLVLLVAMANLATAQDPSAEPGKQQAATITLKMSHTMRYLIYFPQDYSVKKPAPMLLFLHGAGERGEDLERVKKHGPPKLIAKGKHFPFIVVSPQCPADQRWEPNQLLALLDQLQSEHAVDLHRVYVTGLSMGGFGSWALASYAPDRFAAIAPICGGGEKFWVRRLKETPVWAFHGAKDTVVPLRRSEELVETLKQQGGNVKFTIYPDATHDSWTATYDNPKLYEWFLEQKR